MHLKQLEKSLEDRHRAHNSQVSRWGKWNNNNNNRNKEVLPKEGKIEKKKEEKKTGIQTNKKQNKVEINPNTPNHDK